MRIIAFAINDYFQAKMYYERILCLVIVCCSNFFIEFSHLSSLLSINMIRKSALTHLLNNIRDKLGISPPLSVFMSQTTHNPKHLYLQWFQVIENPIYIQCFTFTILYDFIKYSLLMSAVMIYIDEKNILELE